MSENKDKNCQPCHITSIGGSAVMEGVMMKGPKEIATAVRKPDGEIIIDKKPVGSLITKYHVNKIPLVRGVFGFFDSMVSSMKALMYSAEFVDLEGEEEEMSKFEKWLTEKLGDKMKDVIIYFSVVIAILFSVGLFMLLPHAISSLINFGRFTAAVEGIIRITIFLGYILLVSQMEDIKRVFQYHGAEHKTIFCYEQGLELTPENAAKMSRLHPRCGTSFLVFVMVISIIIFSLVPNYADTYGRLLGTLAGLGVRILLLPVVAGLSYELIRWAGKSQNKVVTLLSKPGMWMQKITTREPDEKQLEVAIAAMKAVLTDNKEDDKW